MQVNWASLKLLFFKRLFADSAELQTKPIKCSADCHMSADTSNLPSVRRKRSLHPSTIHGDWAKIGFVCTACTVHCTASNRTQ